MTSARLVTGLSPACKGASRLTFAIAVRTRTSAFSVASSLSLWIHEQCSRMLAISTMYGFSPASSAALRKVASCIRGEQEPMTTAVRLYSLIAFLTSCCPFSEHMY